MKIGNWEVQEHAIEWTGDSENRFIIDKGTLAETTDLQDGRGDLYNWIVLVTEEDWLTVDDLYDFNFAFVYAAGLWSEQFDYEVFDKSVDYQFDLLEEEEEEEEEE